MLINLLQMHLKLIQKNQFKKLLVELLKPQKLYNKIIEKQLQMSMIEKYLTNIYIYIYIDIDKNIYIYVYYISIISIIYIIYILNKKHIFNSHKYFGCFT